MASPDSLMRRRCLQYAMVSPDSSMMWRCCDISWLRPEYAPLSTVMQRCDDPAANRGRESGAYLEHIVANYDDGLAEWTVFSQAGLARGPRTRSFLPA